MWQSNENTTEWKWYVDLVCILWKYKDKYVSRKSYSSSNKVMLLNTCKTTEEACSVCSSVWAQWEAPCALHGAESNTRQSLCVSVCMVSGISCLPVCGINESSIRNAHRPTEIAPLGVLTATSKPQSVCVCVCVYLRQGLDHCIQQGSHSCRHLQQLQNCASVLREKDKWSPDIKLEQSVFHLQPLLTK